MTVADDTLKFFKSKSCQAVLGLVVVWTVAFSMILNVDVLTGRHIPGSRSFLGDLVHGPSERVTEASVASVPREHDTLITYVYSESAFGRENLKFFLRMGLHRAADFVFIFNGETSATDLPPAWDNVKIVRRNNTCYDMGAVGEVLRTDDLWKKYKKFISLNASLRGPFIPYWSDTCWSERYLSKVTATVKFVGLTVNCYPRGHVQSMIFATDAIGMDVLLDPRRAVTGVADKYGGPNDPVGLSGCYNDHRAAVHSEIGLTTLMEQAGYKVDAMMAAFHQVKDIDSYCLAMPDVGDVMLNNHYFGSNLHPYDTVFLKTNRNLDKAEYVRLSEWHLKRNVTAYDLCPAN